MDNTNVTERAIRALTCVGCAADEHCIGNEYGPWHIGQGKTIHGHKQYPCTSKHAELLLLFNAGMEQARIEQDERWVDAMGWTDLVHNGPYTQSDRENYVNLLVDSVTHNMHEEAPPEQIATAVAGAYAAAAKHHEVTIPGEPGGIVTHRGACSCGGLVADGVTPWAILWERHILALTPAEARQQMERMACGHLKADWIEEADGQLEEGGFVHYGHCRTCAAIASAETRARQSALNDAADWFESHQRSHEYPSYISATLRQLATVA